MTLVEQMWNQLDSVMDELTLLETNQDDVDDLVFEARLKGRARGMADMIAIFMHPHFADTNEVAREAKRRAEARARQDKDYVTRGLAQLRYQSPPTDDTEKYKREPRKSVPKLPVTEEEAAKIRMAFDTFPIEMLAKAYKLTEQQIREIAASKPTEAAI